MKLLRFWFKVIRRQASHNRSVLISLAACLALLVLVVQILTNLQTAKQTLSLHTYGSQNGFFFDCSNELIDSLSKDTRVSSLGVIYQQGLVSNPLSEISEKVSIGTFDEIAQQMSHLELAEGNWPQNSSEIAIEQIALLTMRLDVKIGDQINLSSVQTQQDGLAGDTLTKTYTLVGILKNYSYMQFHPETSEAVFKKMPSVFTAYSEQTINSAVSRAVSLKLNDNIKYFPFFREVAKRFNLSLDQYYLNTAIYPPDATLEFIGSNYQKNLSSHFPEVDNAVGYDQLSTSTQSVLSMMTVLLVIVTLFSVLTTLIIFRKKHEKTVLYLRLAGASTTQIILFSGYQIGLYLLVLLPFGLGAGFLSAYAVARLIIRDSIPYFNFVFRIDLTILIALGFTVVLIVVFAFMTYLPLKLRPLTGDNEQSDKKRLTPVRVSKNSKLESRPVWLWALRSFRENQIALSGVIFTLAICFSVMLVSSLLIAEIDQTRKYYARFDAVISNSNINSVSDFNIPLIMNSFSTEDINNLYAINDIESIYALSTFPVNLVGTQQNENIQKLSSLGFIDTEEEGINDPKTIASEKAQYGYESEERIYTGTLIGADRATLNSLKQFVLKGEIDYQQLMAGNAVILVTRNKNPTAKIGDNLTLTQVVRPASPNSEEGESVQNDDISSWVRKDVQVTIAAIVYLSEQEKNLPIGFTTSDSCLVWGNESFRLFGINNKITSVYIDLNNYLNDQKLRSNIERLNILYPDMDTSLRSEFDRQVESNDNSLQLTAYGILLLLFCFAVFSIYSFSQSLAARNRRIIGALRAGGLSYNLMKRLKLIESTIIILFAYILANFLSIGIMLVFVTTQNTQNLLLEVVNIFKGYPLLEISISLPLMIFLTLYFYLLPIRRLYKLPICELLQD